MADTTGAGKTVKNPEVVPYVGKRPMTTVMVVAVHAAGTS
jgi:hypothetical protein